MKPQAVIDLGHRRLRAVEALVDRGRATLVRSLDVALPEGFADLDHAGRGAFVAAALRDAGFVSDRATWTLVRDRLALKRVPLSGAQPDELPGMVRLAMLREAAVGPDAVIDFVPSGPDAWAVAAPAEEVEAVRAVAEAAGIGVERIAPRTFGTAFLLETLPAREGDGADAVAAIDLSGDAVELVIAGRDGLRASRGTAIDDDAIAAAVTEARRSWTAFRLQQPEQRPASIEVVGAVELASRVTMVLASEVGIPVARLASHPDVAAEPAPGAAWPLLGLLLEGSRRRQRINLAAPRRAPDLAARRRMRAYAVVAVLGIAYALGWTLGRRERAGIEAQRTDLRAKADGALQEHRAFRRDELRIRHLEAWVASDPAWLDSMLYLCGFAPDPSRVVLAGWKAQAMADEAVAAKDGSMQVPRDVRIDIDAEAADRATADALREALVAKRQFSVRSTSTEGKAGRRLPVAVELVIDGTDGPPLERSAATAMSRRGGTR